MAQNNTINGQQQAGSAPSSLGLVEQFLQDQLLQRGHMTKASLRLQLAKVQNMMDKTRDKVDKCKQKVEETLCVMREHEAALNAAAAEEYRLKALLQQVPMDTSVGRI